MKKLILLLSVVITSCNNRPQPTKPELSGPKGETFKGVTIDGCQYIIMYGFYSSANTVIVHKGNCNNPIHKY